MEHIKVGDVIEVHAETHELRTTKIYHDTLVDISTNRTKSGVMLFGLIKAELEKKYNGVNVDFKFASQVLPNKGWLKHYDVPTLVLTFHNGKTYNKFKLVEGLVGKE